MMRRCPFRVQQFVRAALGWGGDGSVRQHLPGIIKALVIHMLNTGRKKNPFSY